MDQAQAVRPSPLAKWSPNSGDDRQKIAHKDFLQGVECRAPCPQQVAVTLAAEESLPGFLATRWTAEIWLGARITQRAQHPLIKEYTLNH